MDISLARVTTVLLLSLRAVALLLAVSISLGTSQAEVIYTFSGQIPSDLPPSEYTHPRISPGETWTATLIVDETTLGGDWGGYHSYDGAVKGGLLVFSGGYVSPIDFTPYSFRVSNDLGNRDSVQIYKFDWQDEPDNAGFMALSHLNPLSSEKLPGPGTKIVSTFTLDPFQAGGFKYRDSLGKFSYRGDQGPIAFSAEVPEPTSLAIASVLGAALVVIRRHR